MINTFEVTSLKGIGNHELEFNPDLNILTGKNGSGKTTLLKLIWYMLSPNLERIIPEIIFRKAKLTTDRFTLSIDRKPVKNREQVTILFNEAGKQSQGVELMTDEFHDPVPLDKVEDINKRILALGTSSLFFPTFRRIEGGFSIEPHRRYQPNIHRISSNLAETMASYSQMMTVHRHKFVASISTVDIEDLLTEQYANVADSTNELHTKLSRFITKRIGRQKTPKAQSEQSDKAKLRSANDLIEDIRQEVNDVEKKRNELMKPFTVLSGLISKIFKDKGIRISSNLTFGETKEAIQASILSAGEKQILSFLCYNAFSRNTPIFIDEPELSLHVDWQRMLFSTLQAQGTENQFIVSTHSPFIYSKYPEKEFILPLDKGDN